VKHFKSIRRRMRFWVLMLLLGPTARLPRGMGLRVFTWLGCVAWVILPRTRRVILQNVQLVHPEWPAAVRRRFGRRVMEALGRNAFDFIRLRGYSEADLRALVAVEGLENLERARRPGIGVICLGAHLGCWELIPGRLRAEGFTVGVVYRQLRSPELHAYVTARRARVGIETLDRDGDARRILRSLRRGALLGVLIDQRTQVDSVRVPFLGHPAWTPTGPARLAMRTGAPVVTVVSAMRPDGTHGLMIGPQVEMETPPAGSSSVEEADCIARNTARCSAALCAAIEPWEEQWVWFHRRWRERRVGAPEKPLAGARAHCRDG
jgi:Kdo2-lipid IVA lauroyltransferase/acyltransferase